jgi:uridine kinase
MDDFYLSIDDPRLPRLDALPDWESKQSVALDSLSEAVKQLLRGEEVTLPRYDMITSRRAGERRVSPSGARVIVVEGLYVFDLRPAGAGRVTRVLLAPPPALVAWRRLRRDLKERRYGLAATPRQTLRFLIRYRRYGAEEARRADHVLRDAGHCRAIAEKIRELTGYWDG